MATITVIVNNGNVVPKTEERDDKPTEDNPESDLARAIKEAGSQETITESGSQYPFIANDALSALYQTDKKLKIAYDDYNITIKGSDIRNVNNEFSTEIKMWKTSDVVPDAVAFSVSEDRNLPGDLEIEFLSLPSEYRFLYLYNVATKEYERLNMEDGQKAKIEYPGSTLSRRRRYEKTAGLFTRP